MTEAGAGPRRRWLAILAIGALVAAVGIGLIVTQPSTAGSPASLEVVEADVEVKSTGDPDFAEAATGDSIEEGSVIRTDRSGLAAVSYADGSLTRIGPASTYEIVTLRTEERRREIVGSLDTGQTFHRVAEVTGSGSRFEVQTSKAVAAVRGTSFAVQCLILRSCEIGVVDGKVVVRTPDGREIEVPAGRRVTVDSEGNLGDLELLSSSDPWIERNVKLNQQSSADSDDSGEDSEDPSVDFSLADESDDDDADGSDTTGSGGSQGTTATTRAPGTTSTTEDSQELDFTPQPSPQPDRIDGSDDTTTTTAAQSTSTTRSSASTTNTTQRSTTTSRQTTTTRSGGGTTSTAPVEEDPEESTTTAAPTTQQTTTTEEETTTTTNPEASTTTTTEPCGGEEEPACPCPEGEATNDEGECEEEPPDEDPCTTGGVCVPPRTSSSGGVGGGFLQLLSFFGLLGGITYVGTKKEQWSE